MLEAVEGGHKLALIYRLMHRSADPLPMFQSTQDAMCGIIQIVEEWQHDKALPKLAFHVLDTKYQAERRV